MVDDRPVGHGFPHLETVRSAINALYRRLSYEGVSSFSSSVAAADVAFADGDDLHLGVQRVARLMVAHLRLPDARMVVSFREMPFAARVELAAGPEYFVELNDRFRTRRRDVGAALAHEVMHVYLHRLGLEFAGTRDNEILTDTATAYLGAGWLLLDAFREDAVERQKLGYLTPEEYGYVLAKRAALFGEDPSPWFTSPQAYTAYGHGRERAERDGREPPLRAAGWSGRLRYARDRRRAAGHGEAGGVPVTGPVSYVFDGRGAREGAGREGGGGVAALRVSFACPTCLQRIRLPVRGPVRARCGVCRTVLECDT